VAYDQCHYLKDSQHNFLNFLSPLPLHQSTQASFNTMRYKGRGSALGIDRKLSVIRPGATALLLLNRKGQ
jgi:hypothetical protein